MIMIPEKKKEKKKKRFLISIITDKKFAVRIQWETRHFYYTLKTMPAF